MSVQKYEHVSNEGIRFAATGLCSGCAVNYGMRFKWISSANELSYEYVLMTELAESRFRYGFLIVFLPGFYGLEDCREKCQHLDYSD